MKEGAGLIAGERKIRVCKVWHAMEGMKRRVSGGDGSRSWGMPGHEILFGDFQTTIANVVAFRYGGR